MRHRSVGFVDPIGAILSPNATTDTSPTPTVGEKAHSKRIRVVIRAARLSPGRDLSRDVQSRAARLCPGRFRPRRQPKPFSKGCHNHLHSVAQAGPSIKHLALLALGDDPTPG